MASIFGLTSLRRKQTKRIEYYEKFKKSYPEKVLGYTAGRNLLHFDTLMVREKENISPYVAQSEHQPVHLQAGY